MYTHAPGKLIHSTALIKCNTSVSIMLLLSEASYKPIHHLAGLSLFVLLCSPTNRYKIKFARWQTRGGCLRIIEHLVISKKTSTQQLSIIRSTRKNDIINYYSRALLSAIPMLCAVFLITCTSSIGGKIRCPFEMPCFVLLSNYTY